VGSEEEGREKTEDRKSKRRRKRKNRGETFLTKKFLPEPLFKKL
jgi:hypothetical protein